MTDLDDLYVDSLKEQATELGISLDEEIPASPSTKEKSTKKKFDPKSVAKTAKKEVTQLKEEIKEEKRLKEEISTLQSDM